LRKDESVNQQYVGVTESFYTWTEDITVT